MNRETIRKALYDKYIEPTKKERKDYIGIEIEMPVLNLDKEAVDFSVIHKITDEFLAHFDFVPTGRDDNGDIYAACHEETGDILSFDCSYNNLELSLGKALCIQEIEKRFHSYYTYLQKILKNHHYTLTGMGVNPYRIYNHNVPIPNGRYRMLFHHLSSYRDYHLPMYFHAYPGYGLFSSASQVQLDIPNRELLQTIDVFSLLEPLKAVLFSNSVLLDEKSDLQCCRDMFWENSTHGINPHNVGMYHCSFDSEEDLLSYLESTSIYCVERGDKYINFPPINIQEYFEKEKIEGEYFDIGSYKKITFHPEPQDLQYLRTFKFEDLTFRGTIEFRSCCCQPVSDSMTIAAFHLGAKKNLDKLQTLLDNDHVIYHHGYTATELRKMFVKRQLPGFVDENALYQLLGSVLDLVKEGLEKRNLGEERYLKPLYDRITNRTNPAKHMLEKLSAGTDIEEIILEYASL